MGIMPLGLANRPEMHELGHDVFQAFNVLSSSRQIGMNGPQPITLGEMMSFCFGFGITDLDEREQFVAAVQKLDGAYMKRSMPTDTKTKSEVVTPPRAADNSAKG